MRKFFLTILLLAAGPALAQNPTTGPIGPRDYPGLATATDLVRLGIGGFPFADEYQAGGPTLLTQGFVSALRVPAGAVPNPGSADNALAGYGQTASANRGVVGVYGEGGIMVNGGTAWGVVGLTVNCENHSVSNCGLGKGFNFGAIQNEFDTSIYKVGGAAPTGNAFGVISILAAEVQPTGAAYAFDVSADPVGGSTSIVPWKVAYATEQGSATVGLSLGPPVFDPGTGDRSSLGQSVNLYSRKTDGTVFLSSFQMDKSGNLIEGNNAGATFGFMAAFPEWQMRHDNNGATGLHIFNNTSGGTAVSELILQTGTANSSLALQVAESTHTAILMLDAGVTGGLAIQSIGVSVQSSLTVQKSLELTAEAEPTTPAAGFFDIYMNVSDNKLYAKGPSGTVTPLALP